MNASFDYAKAFQAMWPIRPVGKMNNVKTKFYMKKMHEEKKMRPMIAQELFGVGEKR